MGLFDALRGQFIDVIEWLDDSEDTLAYRFERQGNEIKNGAKLIVRPGQTAVFVNEGQVADEFGEGTYTLSTQNLPILTTLKSWPHGFNSPFKAEVYFFNTRQFTGLKWGTPHPITLRDPELGPVRLRAFGTYSMRIAHGATLLRQLISTNPSFETDDIADQLRAFMTGHFAEWIGKGQVGVYDLAASYTKIGEAMRVALQPDFAQYGLEVMHILIESVSLPPEVEAAIDKRTQMGILGDMNRYTQFQAANAIEESAKNPGGGNPALDLAMGIAMGNQLQNSMQAPSHSGAGAGTPPPLPTASWFIGVDGKQEGPFDLAALAQRSVTRETLVWKQGMAGWESAGDVAELAGLFANVPPPLPR